jgi:Sulfotransferase domain
VIKCNDHLRTVPQEDGLLLLANHPAFKKNVAIRRSWLATGTPILRYEDLLKDDEAILQEVLLSHCRLRVSREHLLNAVRGCRFESLTGRPPGKEDIGAHERKGIAGDWRNHFTAKIANHFERYDDLLAAYSKAPKLSVCCAASRSSPWPQITSEERDTGTGALSASALGKSGNSRGAHENALLDTDGRRVK